MERGISYEGEQRRIEYINMRCGRNFDMFSFDSHMAYIMNRQGRNVQMLSDHMSEIEKLFH